MNTDSSFPKTDSSLTGLTRRRMVGLAISAVLVGIQAFALKAYCEYCLLSAILVLSIFLLSPRPWAHKHPQ